MIPLDRHGNPPLIFNGFIVGEGGSLFRKHSSDKIVFLTSSEALEEIRVLTDWIRNNLIPAENNNDWLILKGTDVNSSTFVRLPLGDDVCMASISLWEKGPHVSDDPSYVDKYGIIEKAIQKAIISLELKSLDTYEAGNGTLRIVPRGVNKASAYLYLKSSWLIDPSKTVYVCDGTNDIEIAEKLIADGGGVIAVANAVDKLHQIADLTTTLPSGGGFAEAISKIFPQEFLEASLETKSISICLI